MECHSLEGTESHTAMGRDVNHEQDRDVQERSYHRHIEWGTTSAPNSAWHIINTQYVVTIIRLINRGHKTQPVFSPSLSPFPLYSSPSSPPNILFCLIFTSYSINSWPPHLLVPISFLRFIFLYPVLYLSNLHISGPSVVDPTVFRYRKKG